ncbi:MAG TPA: bifunctional diaminohydroxyphosphoribosylaminopyrimidine deaminase/5-amino-6-(5-phosphoribosylamino)uracil reductase RibD [Hyphomicrobiales bacterium]|nr:bifunctional diaminohydroxyphosphoribosylaminopyrimidine deaminase/5-amino-6-(5-phosphoribosylamino)uracil reductase RibD [Hyphomicrobiales bacterium]
MNDTPAPEDILHMQRCFALAEQALTIARPNPAVGCVIVKDGRIVGEGHTQQPGQPHAEIMALRQAGANARGAIAYVSLEPCAHHGRTGPCSEALVNAGVVRVVYAMEDPNPLVSGKGLAALRDAGVDVCGPLLETEATALNPGFFKRMRTGFPYVRCKVGMSLDGRTAMASGESQWITGEEARADVQRFRARSCAVLTGVGTVLADDPSLNVRLPDFIGVQPLRVVVDSQARLPAAARLLQLPGRVLQAGCVAPAAQAERAAAQTQAEHDAAQAGSATTQWDYRQLPGEDGKVQLSELLRLLAQDYHCNEILVEAGATLTGALLQQGLVDELLTYVAPLLLGPEGRPLAHLAGLERLDQALRFDFLDVVKLGKDCRIRSLPANRAG